MSKKVLTISLIKAIIATFLFLLIYKYANIQIVHNFAKEKSFDLINSFVLEDLNTKTNSSGVMLFGIDDHYLKSQKLIDDRNRTNYGYIFPNDKIAEFIEDVDTHCQKLSKDKQPKAMFIDYDFSFSSMVYGRALSNEDRTLLNVLKKPREYVILLPKSSDYNFIESSTDKIIEQLIRDKKIVFVSVPVTKSKDFNTRRYIPYHQYKNSKTGIDQNYTIASLALWQLSSGEQNITNEFKQQHVVENRFIVKSYKAPELESSSFMVKKSNWENLIYYSANALSSIPKESFENRLILLGATYSSSTDKFNINSTQNPQLSGVEVLANALMTHFYFDGKLKSFNLYVSLILVFGIYFLSCFFTDRVLGITPNRVKILLVKREISKMTISLFFAMVLMAIVSVVILLVYQQWFDWGISLMLFGSSATVWGAIWFVVQKMKKEA